MNPDIETDVVIVGAGLGGLSAARHLQERGYKVVVIEHHSKPGGYAHFFRKEEFRFEVALHALDGLGEGGWARPMFESLGIMDRIEFNELDPFYTVGFPDFEVAIPTDFDQYAAVASDVLPGEGAGFRGLFAAIQRVGHDVARYTEVRRSGHRPDDAEMLTDFPDMAVAFNVPWAVFIDQYLDSPEAKALVSTLWGYLGLPPSRVSAGQFAMTILSYTTAGAWYPTGGSGTMTWAIAEVIEEHGGEIHFRNDVERIEPADEGVVVTTNKGLTVRARAVVSNASPTSTLALLPDGLVDGDWGETAQSETPSLSSLVVHLGVDRDLAAEGWDHHEYFDMPTYDLEADYTAALEGRFEDAGMIISNYTVTDPDNAPAGCTVLVLTTLAPWDHRDAWGTGGDLENYRVKESYQRVKQEAAEKLIARAERRIPGLRDSIVTAHVGTPLTNARYMLQPEGALYGREQTVVNQRFRRSPRTPIPNLFLAGAWVGGGGMTPAVGSGKTAAAAVARYLRSQTTDNGEQRTE